MKSLFISSIALLTAVVGAFAQSTNLRLTPDNIPQILAAMTIEEKAGLIVGAGYGAFKGQTLDYKMVAGAAGNTHAIDRLGVPPLVLSDGPAGLRIDSKLCSWFPNSMLQAASWNTDCVEAIGRAYGAEMKARGVDVTLGPGMNIERNPLCGRNFEYYSEDPLLSGYTAAALVRGIQAMGVSACPKHFAANNQELNRLGNNALISKRALREIYLRNFEYVVKQSQPDFIMSSYNFLNGITTSENRELLTTLLREEWGFKGVVMSDWGAGYRAINMVHAGNDNIQPGGDGAYNDIIQSVDNGTLSMADVDTCVVRLQRAATKAIRYDGGTFSDNPPLEDNDRIIRQNAPEGFVLLKNQNNALPFASGATIAVMGTTSYDLIFGGTGSGVIYNPFTTVQLPQGITDAGLNLDKNIDAFYNTYMKSELKRCENLNKNVAWCCVKERAVEAVPFDLINQAAANDQAAVLTFGRNCGEGSDRDYYHSYLISDGEMQLIRAVSDAFHKQGKPVVAVLNVGAIVDLTQWQDMVDAIMICWLPGQEAGRSIADALAGHNSPSGRLPVSIPVQYTDDPSAPNFPRIHADKNYNYSFYRHKGSKTVNEVPNIDYTKYEEGIYVGYRHYTTRKIKTAYPFGHGITYTTFGYSNLQVRDLGQSLEVNVTIKNTGSRAGKEIAQIYVQAPAGNLDKPLRELKGYAKTMLLQPGQQQTLTISIDKQTLASFDESQSAWIAPAGKYRISACRNAEEPVLNANIKFSKDLIIPTNNILEQPKI